MQLCHSMSIQHDLTPFHSISKQFLISEVHSLHIHMGGYNIVRIINWRWKRAGNKASKCTIALISRMSIASSGLCINSFINYHLAIAEILLVYFQITVCSSYIMYVVIATLLSVSVLYALLILDHTRQDTFPRCM